MNPLSPHHLVKYRAERILAVEAYLERGGRAPECVGRPIDERHELEQKTCLHRPFEGRISPGRSARWHRSGKEYGDSRRPPHPTESAPRSYICHSTETNTPRGTGLPLVGGSPR